MRCGEDLGQIFLNSITCINRAPTIGGVEKSGCGAHSPLGVPLNDIIEIVHNQIVPVIYMYFYDDTSSNLSYRVVDCSK